MHVSECKRHQAIQGKEEKRRTLWSEEAEREAQRRAGHRGNTLKIGDE